MDCAGATRTGSRAHLCVGMLYADVVTIPNTAEDIMRQADEEGEHEDGTAIATESPGMGVLGIEPRTSRV